MDILLELSDYAFEPRNAFQWWRSAPATASSLKRIYDELQVVITPDFVLLSRHCEYYGTWFASIGEDYANHTHIIKLNKLWHDKEPAEDDYVLPSHLVMINHGYDGDCDCLDKDELADGEHQIIYHCAGSTQQSFVRRYPSFKNHLDFLCRNMTLQHTKKRRRKKIEDDPEREKQRLSRLQIEKERNKRAQEILALFSTY